MDEIIALAKRRSFFYPSSLIYGGLANTWDYGHYGTILKNNIKDAWLKRFVHQRQDMFLCDSSIILNPKVWEASGHVDGFSDSMVDCLKCKSRTRADHLIEDNLKNVKVEGLPVGKLTEIIRENKLTCPKCGSRDLTEVRSFNLLFETKIGLLEEKKSKVYLRGELAQGIFMNYKQVLETMRPKLPFGIASTGAVFRNEITLGQGVFRTLQFDLMEFEYFVNSQEWEKTFEYFKSQMHDFAIEIGLDPNKIKFREHEEHERSHYSKKTVDLEYDVTNYKIKNTKWDKANAIENSGLSNTQLQLANTSVNTSNPITTGTILRVVFYYAKENDYEDVFFSKNGTAYTDKRFGHILSINRLSGMQDSGGTISGKVLIDSFNQPLINSAYMVDYDYLAPKDNERITINYEYNKLIVDATEAIEDGRPITADVLVKAAEKVELDVEAYVIVSSAYSENSSTVQQDVADNITATLSANALGTTLDSSDIIDGVYNVDGVDRVRIIRFNKHNVTGTKLSITAQKNQYLAPGTVAVTIEER